MRNLLFIIVGTLLLGCSGPSQNKNIVESNPFLVGKWSGEGSFMDVKLDIDIGKIWIEFEIFDDNSVLGKIGDAKIINTKLYEADYGFEISGELSTKVKKGNDLDKDHIFILIVIRDNNVGDIKTSEANFHLKGNSIFDFDMKVGGVRLVKEQIKLE